MRATRPILKPEEQAVVVVVVVVWLRKGHLWQRTQYLSRQLVNTTSSIRALTESLRASYHPYVIENDTNTSVK